MCSFTLLLVSFLGLSGAHAQVLYGSLTGNVTDANGAAVSGASVEALNVNTGVVHKTQTTDGLYRYVEIPPGIYTITISSPGFKQFVRGDVAVAVNSVARVDAQLAVGSQTETVNVTAETPLLQTDKSDVHSDISAEEIRSLPAISSEGKSFQALYRIIPGAGLPSENNSAGGNPQRAMTSNVNGQSSQGNNTRIDGVQDAYPWLPNNIAYVPPEDAIEVVNVTTNSFDAEQGNVGGASVNVQIKSGTNKFHGDVHEFHTDNALWNLNYFNPSNFRKPKNIFNQFGGAVGGPILKDKLFFFGDWESTRQSQAPTGGNPQTVPTGGLLYSAAQTAGFFDFRPLVGVAGGLIDKNGTPLHVYDPRTGNADGSGRSIITCNGVQDTICLSDVDPAAQTMASLIPAPNEAPLTSNFLVRQSGSYSRDNFDGKVNYVASQKSTVFGRYSFSKSFIFDPPTLGAADGNATLGGQLGNAFSRIQVVGLGATHTFSPNLLLDINAGFTRQRITAQATDIGKDYGTDVLHIPGTNKDGVTGNTALYGGIPAFQFVTFSNLGNPNTGNPFLFRDNQYVSNANLTWIKGRHQLRFGIEYNHTQLNHFQPQGGSFQTARGSFKFTGVGTENPGQTPTTAQFYSYADFLLGLPDEVGKAVQNTNPNSLRWSQWAWYARDQWQVTPALTVNYGLRWEFYPAPYSDIGGVRLLDPSSMNVLVGGGNSGIPIDDGISVGHGLFLPRIGVAYRPNSKTVVRAGYGMNADANNWRFLRNAFPAVTISDFQGFGNNAFAPAASLTGLNAVGNYSNLPIGIPTIPINGGTTPGTFPLPDNVGTTTIAKNFRRGYSHSFNFTIEQEFGGFVFDLGYIGSRSIRPLTQLNINPSLATPGVPSTFGQDGRILNAEFGHTAANGYKGWPDINELVPLGNSSYDSLQAKLTRRIGRSSRIGFVYTFSKAIDYEDNEELNSILWPIPSRFALNRAVAGFDRKQNFEAYGLYALPFGRGQRWANHGIGSALAGGWQVNWVLSRMSGTPFTVTDSSTNGKLNAKGSTQVPNLVGRIGVHSVTPKPNGTNCDKTDASCHYFNISAFAPVTQANTFGNAGRDIVRGPGYFNLDASLFRDFRITERFTFEFEANAFSVTNTPHFNNPTTDWNSGTFGQITSTLATANASLGGSGGQRQWWFGGKIIF